MEKGFKYEIGLNVFIVSKSYTPKLIRGRIAGRTYREWNNTSGFYYDISRNGGSIFEVMESEVFPEASHCHAALCALEIILNEKP